MYGIIILPIAKQDIRDAAHWYNSKQLGLGKKFTSEVRKKVKFIQENPEAVSVRYEEIRTVILNVFPYMIHYFVDNDQKQIVISSILHTSRDPKLWKKR